MLLKKLNIIVSIIFCAFNIYNDANAAAIRIARNDVDSVRSGFVTAGFTFSLDILVDSVEKLNGISFELDWDRPHHIFFSEWQIGELGNKSLAFVEKYPGKIIVAVSNGLPLIESQLANTTLISLKFVVLQNSQNLDSVTFSFNKPMASAIVDTQSQLLPLEHSRCIFKIHSYIDVYPGDANADGIVDHLDYSNVMLYLGLGSESQHSRTFKRLYPSIFWVPQKVLVWDTPAATYSDCDGNGEITMKDMLVISYNLGKISTQIGKPQPIIKEFSAISNIPNKLLSNNYSYPIYFQANRNFLSAYISLELNPDYVDNFESVNINSIFNKDYEIKYQKIDGNHLNIFITSNDRSNNLIASGEILNLIFNNQLINNNIIKNMSSEAIDASGEIFPLELYSNQQFTDISNNENNNVSIITHSNLLEIYSNNQIQCVEVYDLLGRTIVIKDDIASNSINMELPNLNSQLLFVSILTNRGERIHYSIAANGFSHLQSTK